jgi:hypothetical protein
VDRLDRLLEVAGAGRDDEPEPRHGRSMLNHEPAQYLERHVSTEAQDVIARPFRYIGGHSQAQDVVLALPRGQHHPLP